MVMIPIYYSDHFLEHQTGLGHPENPGRLTAIKTALEKSPLAAAWDWRAPTPIQTQSPLPFVEKVHTLAYLEQVQQMAARGGGYLDGDTPISAASYEVALLAVNAWLDGVQTVVQTNQPAFVLARPPGHHALANRGMGFCVFANAAIAAEFALTQSHSPGIAGLGLARVAILDWDVHHGNGTQALVENNPQIAYCSLHQSPCYPGTGSGLETGRFQNVLNLPMLPGSEGGDYRRAFEESVIPFLTNWKPDLLIVSAGYDGNAADPLASVNLQPQDFGEMTAACLQITRRILFGLEGGYDYESLSQSVFETLSACLK